jgi:hypothetical protein
MPYILGREKGAFGMTSITLTTELTPAGVVCENAVLGKVATIKRIIEPVHSRWEVFPYAFPPSERTAEFKSYAAAEFYALALAHEMFETQEAR